MNMRKTAFVFPGQGAQKAGMGKDFYEHSQAARQVYQEAGRWLGLDMEALCFEENDRLDVTEYTQAAMVTTCLAMAGAMEEAGAPAPQVTAGLSLGEYCALVQAGVMGREDAVRLVRRRGILMQEAVPAGEGAMAAVLMLAAPQIERVLADLEDVQIANYNCPGQVVISGRTDAVETACGLLKEAGARRTMRLNVSGPFHSKLLTQAGKQMGRELAPVRLKDPRIPYVSNVTAACVTQAAPVKELLTRQIYSPVRWEQSVRTMLADGTETFVEIGPGKTLAGFIRKIDRRVKMVNIETWEDMERYLDEIKG